MSIVQQQVIDFNQRIQSKDIQIEQNNSILQEHIQSTKIDIEKIEQIHYYEIQKLQTLLKFTFCCCELEERTMVFTNLIAKLVHQHIDHSGGVVNRNLGDAFVAVWKVELAKSSDLCSDTSDDERHSWAKWN